LAGCGMLAAKPDRLLRLHGRRLSGPLVVSYGLLLDPPCHIKINQSIGPHIYGVRLD
jgi:hypothetical protein